MANAILKPISGRQYILYAEQPINFAQINDTGVAVLAIKLPFGAEVVGGDLVVDTAWNAGTSATLAIGDVASPSRYLAATSIQAAGRTALTVTNYVSDGNEIYVTPTIAGTAPTAGAARVRLQYVIQNRAHEVQTN